MIELLTIAGRGVWLSMSEPERPPEPTQEDIYLEREAFYESEEGIEVVEAMLAAVRRKAIVEEEM